MPRMEGAGLSVGPWASGVTAPGSHSDSLSYTKPDAIRIGEAPPSGIFPAIERIDKYRRTLEYLIKSLAWRTSLNS